MPMKTVEAIVSGLHQPVLVIDGDLRAVMANPAFYQTLGLAPADLKEGFVPKFVSGESCQPGLRVILESVIDNDGDVQGAEIVCTLPTGKRVILLVNARRIRVETSPHEMILVEPRDITREKKAERRIQALNKVLRKHAAELEIANKELESFSHFVSHDLRVPLRFINRVAHLLLQDHGVEPPDGTVQQVNLILESTNEMAKLIEDLLAFSRVSREPMRKRRVDMRKLAQEVLGELQHEEEGRDIEIDVQDLAPCQGDRALLKEVLLNLLENALKFTRPRKTAQIRVGCTETEGQTVYFVQDNGVGFAMAASEALFVAFHRVHKSSDFEGTGIGLALARRIIDRHGGRIWAEGEVNKGANFRFTLAGQAAGEDGAAAKASRT